MDEQPGSPPVSPPQDRFAIEEIVADHLHRLGRVLSEAWDAFATTRKQAAAQMAFASTSSRGMLVSDFTHEPAHRIFAPVPDVWVDDRYGRPWVNLAGGSVQVRFRKLTADLELCPTHSDRALSLAFHLGDPAIPGTGSFTVLTAGYVLDLAEQGIERLALVCHLGPKDVYYSIPIPLAAATGSSTDSTGPSTDVGVGSWESGTAPAQLPLMPLSPPIIRSAQKTARKRLAAARWDTAGGSSPDGTSGPYGGAAGGGTGQGSGDGGGGRGV